MAFLSPSYEDFEKYSESDAIKYWYSKKGNDRAKRLYRKQYKIFIDGEKVNES